MFDQPIQNTTKTPKIDNCSDSQGKAAVNWLVHPGFYFTMLNTELFHEREVTYAR